MAVKILVDPPKNVRPPDSIRADVAWKLYLPDNMGDLPDSPRMRIETFRHWLWFELSARLGYLRKDLPETVYILTPPLTAAGKEFVVRTASFWTDEVFAVTPGNGEYDITRDGDNLWIPPVVNVGREYERDSAIGKFSSSSEEGIHTPLSHVLGATRSHIRTYTINPGHTFARYHSHTAREEFYLVLEGRGSVRIGGHKVEVSQGDLISKPTGPDLSSQFLADLGEAMKIMDVEIWPEDERKSKDAVHYPDHGELDLFGEGWFMTVPGKSIISAEDAMKNYDTGYTRKADGSWEARDIPGFKKREK